MAPHPPLDEGSAETSEIVADTHLLREITVALDDLRRGDVLTTEDVLQSLRDAGRG